MSIDKKLFLKLLKHTSSFSPEEKDVIKINFDKSSDESKQKTIDVLWKDMIQKEKILNQRDKNILNLISQFVYKRKRLKVWN
ncbi:MAG: hypothetical protein OEL89_04845 [Candidatus Peregrinibacteria bacterium]|nr:hypothetical protein [Candidatus Peregrinibacteria bacterium]